MPSCFVVGQTNLTLCCLLELKKAAWDIMGVCSENESVVQFCRQNNVFVYSDFVSFQEELSLTAYQYLFSIVNWKILSKEVLETAQLACINYHDSLLPKYAGLNATSWSLLAGEKVHGISWHIMEEQVDAGLVLYQKMFDIEEDDTALTLNLKCFEAALKGFAVLLKDLTPISSSIQLRKGEGTQATQVEYYKKGQLPDHQCNIDFDWSVDEVSRVLRACDFGTYPNTFSRATVQVEGERKYVKQYRWLPSRSTSQAGTVIHKEGSLYTFATQKCDLEVELE